MVPFEQREEIADSLMGSLIDQRYEIVSRIGTGGMASVYKARHHGLDAYVAIKILHERAFNSSASMKRFQNEAKFACSLSHPNIAKTTAFGIYNDRPYIVLEFIEGQTLAERLKESVLSLQEALPIFRQCCQALQHAHEHGLIHRDIKPSNVILLPTAEGKPSVKVTDFGIAKYATADDADQRLTKTGELLGSPMYMCPEQWTGAVVDERSDIYSFGCMMYEVVTGTPAFSGESAFQLMIQHLNQNPIRPSKLKQELQKLDPLVLKALAKLPAQRYQSFKELLDHIAILETGGTIKTFPGASLGAATIVAGKAKTPVILAAGAIAMLGGLGSLVAWQRSSEPPVPKIELKKPIPAAVDVRKHCYERLYEITGPDHHAVRPEHTVEAFNLLDMYMSNLVKRVRLHLNRSGLKEVDISSFEEANLTVDYGPVLDFSPAEINTVMQIQRWRTAAERADSKLPSMQAWKQFVDLMRNQTELKGELPTAVSLLQAEAIALHELISKNLNGKSPRPKQLLQHCWEEAQMLEWADNLEHLNGSHPQVLQETSRLKTKAERLGRDITRLAVNSARH